MTAIVQLLRNREGAIMIFATPEDIAAKRKALAKWYDDELAAVPKMARLVADMMGGGDGTVERAVITSQELIKARQKADDLLKKYGAPVLPRAIELLDTIDLQLAYCDRREDLARLERRSEMGRFAVRVPAAEGLH